MQKSKTKVIYVDLRYLTMDFTINMCHIYGRINYPVNEGLGALFFGRPVMRKKGNEGRDRG